MSIPHQPRPRLLITNDDGYDAEGLQRLAAVLDPLYEVWVVSPDREQSATSHSLTLRSPLRLHRRGERRFSVDGTPADSVYVGIHYILEKKVDLVLSGINMGPNLGADVFYSGTVAGAMEGALGGVPSIALSLDTYRPFDFTFALSFVPKLVAYVLAHPDRSRPMVLNVNFPCLQPGKTRGVRITALGRRTYGYQVVPREDPKGKEYLWLGGGGLSFIRQEGSDFDAVEDGYVSVTPLLTQWTDVPMMSRLAALEELTDWE